MIKEEKSLEGGGKHKLRLSSKRKRNNKNAIMIHDGDQIHLQKQSKNMILKLKTLLQMQLLFL